MLNNLRETAEKKYAALKVALNSIKGATIGHSPSKTMATMNRLEELAPPAPAQEQPAADTATPAPADTPPAPPVMKQVGEEQYPASDFLLVADPANPETWAFQVSKNGEPDAEMMAAAHMALMGEEYTGEDKPALLEKLKAMYEAASMEWPGSTAAEAKKWANRKAGERMLVESYMDYMGSSAYVPWGAKTFADVKQANAAHEALEQVRGLTGVFCELVCRTAEDAAITDKLAAYGELAKEFSADMQAPLAALSSGEKPEENPAVEERATPPSGPAELRESATGAWSITDDAPKPDSAIAEAETGTGRRGPITVEVIPIVPGFGNKADGHYYPAAMLQKYAHMLEGVPMFLTDHNRSEKNERTKTAVIQKVLGFTENGAPRVSAVVYDPDHAEKIRNQRDSGTLPMLECSIHARGVTEPGEVDGQKCNIVKEITAYESVDWVSKAGAGGHVASVLTEAASGNPSPRKIMSDAAVIAELKKHISDERIISRVMQRGIYESAAQVKAALDSELEYIREFAGGSRPPAFNSGASNSQTKPITEAEFAERQRQVNAHYFGR